MIQIYFHTIKNLKLKQILFRFYYSMNILDKKRLISFVPKISYPLNIQESLRSYVSYYEENTFIFLNKSFTFGSKINWNYKGYGLLWVYNLNYFEFLLQPNLDKEKGLRLINDFIFQYKEIKVGYDSYPVSLRNVFWIKFLTKHSINDERIDAFLFSQYNILLHNLEYHLLGNHLLENAFSLLIGAYYFRELKIYKKACMLLQKELNEQILNDGGHFELSPMYHQILLYRLLDCINIILNNKWIEDDLFLLLTSKATLMLSWLQNIVLGSGLVPLINDSTNLVAPFSNDLFDYAKRLNIKFQLIPFSDSSYRLFSGITFKCIMDIGGIIPKYQPGHAHADTFNFVLEINGKLVLVDTGCSTYETGAIRDFERGTTAHNTVSFNEENSSQIWGSHRVGKKANVKIIQESYNQIIVQHDGFKNLGIIHQRSFYQIDGSTITIIDEVIGNNDIKGIAYFHLDQEITDIQIESNHVFLPVCKIIFDKPEEIVIKQFSQALGFNQRVDSICICVRFQKKLTTSIEL